ncbi:sugar-transfer associated ATP-grasp domain-containing protein [Agriterribacter humi]|uniref:sugar-transfer associated ATP-grasp domain-containing protein n=1 Tax=Agriterribacter humi TaxID=1104781 RepID=UPI00186B310E|nr:sugar-transfer associated ATP-grasp domain-containing protein [Agriterribacter humi]
MRYVKNEKNVSTVFLLKDILFSSIKYKISFMDYFSFKFYNLGINERNEYIGSGAMYEYQLKMNPKKHRTVLSDKIAFLKRFDDFAGRNWATLSMIKADAELANVFLNCAPAKIVLKHSRGQAGKAVEVCETASLNRNCLIEKMERNNFNLLETYVLQNNVLMNLSPSALNTVRLVTQLYKGEVIIIAARLRISINSKVDNVSAGNIIVPVDKDSGKVVGPGIYADITKPDEYIHPVTGVHFIGFEIPFWSECLRLVTQAALRIPENRSVGWDVAITNTGPLLIEGNHNWHYLSLQMPDKKGYKKEMLKYMD